MHLRSLHFGNEQGGYTHRDYITKWILGFGDRAEVIFPEELKEEIKSQAKKILQKYEQLFEQDILLSCLCCYNESKYHLYI